MALELQVAAALFCDDILCIFTKAQPQPQPLAKVNLSW